MSNPATVVRLLVALLLICGVVPTASTTLAVSQDSLDKLDPLLRERAASRAGTSRVIVRGIEALPTGTLADLIQQVGGVAGRRVNVIRGRVGEVPNAALEALASSPYVAGLSLDRLIV